MNHSNNVTDISNVSLSWKNRLQELCHARTWNSPVYTTRRTNDRMWVSTVSVNNISVTGDSFQRKVDSEKSAAYKLFNILNSVEEDSIQSSDQGAEEVYYIDDLPELYDLISRFGSDISNSIGASLRVPSQSIPSQSIPSQSIPSQSIPSQSIPSQSIPSQSIPRFDTVLQRERTFSTNIFDESFLNHLTLLVRGKNIEISNDPEYKSDDAPVVIYLLDDLESITSNFVSMNSVKVNIPLLSHRISFQAMILLSVCMELGADSCTIVGIPAGQVNRVILT